MGCDVSSARCPEEKLSLQNGDSPIEAQRSCPERRPTIKSSGCNNIKPPKRLELYFLLDLVQDGIAKTCQGHVRSCSWHVWPVRQWSLYSEEIPPPLTEHLGEGWWSPQKSFPTSDRYKARGIIPTVKRCFAQWHGLLSFVTERITLEQVGIRFPSSQGNLNHTPPHEKTPNDSCRKGPKFHRGKPQLPRRIPRKVLLQAEEKCHSLQLPLAAQCEVPPPYRAIPFRDSIAEGGIASICLVFMGYRASIAEIPLLWGGYRTSTSHALQGGNAQKRGRAYRTQLAMLRHQKTIARKRGYRWDSLAVSRNTGPLNSSTLQLNFVIFWRGVVANVAPIFPACLMHATVCRIWTYTLRSFCATQCCHRHESSCTDGSELWGQMPFARRLPQWIQWGSWCLYPTTCFTVFVLCDAFTLHFFSRCLSLQSNLKHGYFTRKFANHIWTPPPVWSFLAFPSKTTARVKRCLTGCPRRVCNS